VVQNRYAAVFPLVSEVHEQHDLALSEPFLLYDCPQLRCLGGDRLTVTTLPRLTVYSDAGYPSSWIEKPDAVRLAQALQNRGYTLISSTDLETWMKGWIRKGISKGVEPTVVFSQDVAPRSIAYPSTAECLVRSFLDHGGRIVWAGDIPFFWITQEQKGSGKEIPKDRAALAGVKILGIVSAFTFPTTPVRLTRLGKSLGLKSQWSGHRPVISFRFNPRNLGSSRNLIARPTVAVPMGFAERGWTRGIKAKLNLRLLQLESPEDAVSQDLPDDVKEARLASIRYFRRWGMPNAWLQQYSGSHPNSGFLRVWDCPIKSLTGSMINEVDSVARAKWSSLRRRLYPYFLE
jgi:hypothetical protein